MARLRSSLMQTLVSTRLFSDSPIDGEALDLLAERGFVALEIHATPKRLDLRSPTEAELLRRHLEAEGFQAPWVYLAPSYLPHLGRELRLHELTATLHALRAEALVLPREAWIQAQGLPKISEIRSYVQQAGARLLADARSLDDAPAIDSPELGLCLDVAFHPDAEAEAERIEAVPRWRLQGVRVAHCRDDFRDLPGEEEACFLEDLWPKLAPSTLVYDVETGGGRAEIGHALDEIRAFHMGERRPPERRGGGVFWASLAPG